MPEPHGGLGMGSTEVRCRLLGIDDDGYADAVASYNTLYTHRPAVVALPETTAEVVEAVLHARRLDLPIAVQGTGHGARANYDGALLINTSRLRALRLDPDARTVRVGAGVTWAEVLAAAGPVGLAPLCGTSPAVGVVGYTLGGGFGWLQREYGASSDHVRSVEVVTTDGRILTAGPTEHPDLFDALLGSGGCLAVVTAIELELLPVETVFGGGVVFPLDRAREVMIAYRDWCATAPPVVTSTLVFVQLPPAPSVPEELRGLPAIGIMACVDGDEQRGVELLAPLRELPGAVLDTFRTLPYEQVGQILGAPTDPVPTVTFGTAIRALDDATIDSLLTLLGPGANSEALVQIRHVGGTEPPGTRRDFGYADVGYALFAFEVAPTPDAVAASRARLDRFAATLAPHTTGGIPVSFAGTANDPAEVLRSALHEQRYERLRKAKAAFDPENRLRFAYPVDPGAR